jgi:hypothetical protein
MSDPAVTLQRPSWQGTAASAGPPATASRISARDSQRRDRQDPDDDGATATALLLATEFVPPTAAVASGMCKGLCYICSADASNFNMIVNTVVTSTAPCLQDGTSPSASLYQWPADTDLKVLPGPQKKVILTIQSTPLRTVIQDSFEHV